MADPISATILAGLLFGGGLGVMVAGFGQAIEEILDKKKKKKREKRERECEIKREKQEADDLVQKAMEKQAESERELERERESNLKQKKEADRKMEDQQKETEQKMEELQKNFQSFTTQVEMQRTRAMEEIREEIDREKQERIESQRRLVMDMENKARIFFRKCIHLFIHLISHRGRAGGTHSQGYLYCSGNPAYKQLLSDIDPDLIEVADEVYEKFLSVRTQHLPMLEDNPKTNLNADESSQLTNYYGNGFALVELPDGFEDDLLTSAMASMSIDNQAESLDAGNSIVHLNQRYGCSKISTPINDGIEAKEQGNAYFKDQNYNEAIKCYSKSINLSPTAAAYGNRAMACIKLNMFIEAEKDCTEALRIDPSYFKAYARRAMARSQLGGNLKGALEDVEVSLKMEPTNIDMRQLRAELREMLGYHGNGSTGSLAIEH